MGDQQFSHIEQTFQKTKELMDTFNVTNLQHASLLYVTEFMRDQINSKLHQLLLLEHLQQLDQTIDNDSIKERPLNIIECSIHFFMKKMS